MITYILVEPIDTLVKPIVGVLDLLRVLKINIFTFSFMLKLGKINPVYHSKKTSTPQKIFANMGHNNNSKKVI